MKAWVLEQIGSLELKEVQDPEISEDQVLVEVRAAGICGSDIARVYETGAHRMPLIPGHEFAGKVIKTGQKVSTNWLNKRVGVFPLIPCRECSQCKKSKYEMCENYSYLGSRTDGGFAQYVAVPQWNLIEIPDQVCDEAAAMLEPMAVAAHAIRRVNPEPGQKVAIIGFGTIGQLVAMLLVEKGIKDIYVFGNKKFHRQSAEALGIPEEHFSQMGQASKDLNQNAWADIVFECVGKNETITQSIAMAAPGGEICLVGNPHSQMEFDKNTYWNILRRQLKLTGTWNSTFYGADSLHTEQDDWRYVLERLEQNRIHPEQIITQRYGMESLDQGFLIMKNKLEDYAKIMMIL